MNEQVNFDKPHLFNGVWELTWWQHLRNAMLHSGGHQSLSLSERRDAVMQWEQVMPLMKTNSPPFCQRNNVKPTGQSCYFPADWFQTPFHSSQFSFPVCQKVEFGHSPLLSHPDAAVSPWCQGRTCTTACDPAASCDELGIRICCPHCTDIIPLFLHTQENISIGNCLDYTKKKNYSC